MSTIIKHKEFTNHKVYGETLAVLAALLKQAVGAGLTARGLDENGEPRRNLPGRPQEN